MKRQPKSEATLSSRPYSPYEKAMRGVAEVHLVGMDMYPLRAQPAREVAAHTRGENLRQREPDDRSNPNRRHRRPPASTMARRRKGLTRLRAQGARALAPPRRMRHRPPPPRTLQMMMPRSPVFLGKRVTMSTVACRFLRLTETINFTTGADMLPGGARPRRGLLSDPLVGE